MKLAGSRPAGASCGRGPQRDRGDVATHRSPDLPVAAHGRAVATVGTGNLGVVREISHRRDRRRGSRADWNDFRGSVGERVRRSRRPLRGRSSSTPRSRRGTVTAGSRAIRARGRRGARGFRRRRRGLRSRGRARGTPRRGSTRVAPGRSSTRPARPVPCALRGRRSAASIRASRRRRGGERPSGPSTATGSASPQHRVDALGNVGPSCSASAKPSPPQSLSWRWTWHGFTSPIAPDSRIAVPPDAPLELACETGRPSRSTPRGTRARARPDGSRRSRRCRCAHRRRPITSSDRERRLIRQAPPVDRQTLGQRPATGAQRRPARPRLAPRRAAATHRSPTCRGSRRA